jgi:hypothetical protein
LESGLGQFNKTEIAVSKLTLDKFKVRKVSFGKITAFENTAFILALC